MSISGVSSGAAVVGAQHHLHHRGQGANSQGSDSNLSAQTQAQSASDSANTAIPTSQAQDSFLALLGSLSVSDAPQYATTSAIRAAYSQWS